MVMARGVMEHGEFQVHFMTQPASELRENSIAAHSSCHFFGSRASIQELVCVCNHLVVFCLHKDFGLLMMILLLLMVV